MSIWFLILLTVVLLFSFVLLRGAPYVPSRRNYAKRALRQLYPVGPKDVLVDVGSGDGVVLRIAATMGATAIGYELNPALVIISKLLGLGYAHVTTHLADFWRVELPADTTVVYVFMIARMSKKLEKKLQLFVDKQGRSLKVIAYGIPFKDRQPDDTYEAYFLYTFQPLQSRKGSV